jgi:4-amino-4-deoxy-L-arabinose transferase-like glycosyltransferase
MQEPLATHHSPRTKTDWLLIGLLLALVLPLRLWLICNTEVTARDSIGYIRYALQFEQYGWKETLLKNHQHPGYPAMVWLMSQPVRAIAGATTPENMELSAQLVNLFASLLLIVPMYWLGRQFFDRTVSFGAVVLYQYLPISAQHLSDGISEPVFLVLMVNGLLQAVQAVRERSVWRCQLFGLFAGLAYLTRPEGALLLPAFGIVLVGLQVWPSWRWSARQFFGCGIGAATTAALVGAIYVGTTGQLSNKPTANVILGKEGELTQSIDATTLHLFAASFTRADSRGEQFRQSIRAVLSEINQGFHYVAGIPARLGLFWSFGNLRRHPGFWVVAAFVSILVAILIALGMAASYVSDRHVMILVLLGSFFAVHGLRELPRRVLSLLRVNDTADAALVWWKRGIRSAPVWFAILFATVIAVSLPKATQRLHGNRAGNHAAGLWLAQHIEPAENAMILDDHNWSHFFSGVFFLEGHEPAFPRDYPSKCYVVTTRARDPQVDAERQARVVAANAKVVYTWPENIDPEKARVVVYAQSRPFDKYPWPVTKR